MKFVTIAVITFALILLAGCTDRQWDKLRFWEEVYEPPSQEFKEKCHLRDAFRIYRDHEGVWSCKLEDGRVMTEKNFRKFLNN